MILSETLEVLRDRGRLSSQVIQSLHLTPYFTVVELSDGSVGAAMSYYGRPDDLRSQVPPPAGDDPLLLRWLFPEGGASTGPGTRIRLLQLSVGTAVLGALSAPWIRGGGDGTFVTADVLPFEPFTEVRRAVVIGFGGYMPQLASAPAVERLHVCDLGYPVRRAHMDQVLEGFRSGYPSREFSISDGSDLAWRVRETDLLAVTGSALCNGTLDNILEVTPGTVRVIVQGQSASLHPFPLFARGVWFVATTIKPPELVRAAAADPTGNSLRPYLEGGLPRRYLLPAGESCTRQSTNA
jgi:hypothetical protein